MKNKRKIISSFSLSFMLLSSVLLSSCSDNSFADDGHYLLLNDGTYKIISLNVSSKDTRVTIPSKYNGKTVTAIGPSIFFNDYSIKELIIPATINQIDIKAFETCPNIEKITVAKNNHHYDSRDNCNAIIDKSSNTLIAGCKNSTIPDSVTAIGDFAFYDCSFLEEINIPNNVKSIGNGAFQKCYNLDEVIIGDNVTILYQDSFANCNNIDKIVLGKSISNIKTNVFNETTFNNIYYNGTIQDWLKLPIDKISNNNPFTLNSDNSNKGISFYLRNSDETYTELKHLVIPEGELYSIREEAFLNCNSIEKITFPKSIVEILNGSFKYCKNLQNIEFDEHSKLSTIYPEAFGNCTNLKDFTLPDSTYDIGENSFTNCKSLENIYIPKNVSYFGGNPFVGCSNIKTMTVDPQNPYFSSYDGSNAIIYKETGILVSGCQNTIIPNNVKTIYYRAFENCTTLKSIEIPDSVTKILEYAFNGCKNLEKVKLPNNLEIIDKWCFANTGLKEVVIPESVNTIRYCAFSSCICLESIFIPKTVETIEAKVFVYNEGLTAFCEPQVRPNGWDKYWNEDISATVWGCTE